MLASILTGKNPQDWLIILGVSVLCFALSFALAWLVGNMIDD